MISYLKGRIILKKEKYIVLEVNNIGYKVFFSKKTLESELKIGNEVEVFCHFNIGEKKMEIYGFLTPEELDFFEVLEQIRGVGPKTALEISSLGSLEKIKERILNHDEKLFEEVGGIGRKKAMAIILELSGKIKDIFKEKKKSLDEAEEGLVNLGFSRQQAKEVLKKIPQNIKDSRERIKESLKILGGL